MVYRSAKMMSTINSLLYLHDKNEVYHKLKYIQALIKIKKNK